MHYENHAYKIEGEELPDCRLSLKIEVKAEEASKAYKKAVKKINKEISIPGFRKGKAPDATVIKNYGDYVEREWKEILVNDAFQGALQLTNIYPYNKETIERPKIVNYSHEGALIHLVYEFFPKVPAIDFSTISIPKIEKEPISDERIQEIVFEIQRANASWEDILDRPVQEGDYVDLSIDAIDEEPAKSIVKDRRFEVNEKRMAPWLKKQLLNLDVDQSVECISEVDEHAEERIKAKFKPTKVRITLHSIKKIILPELNDELAQKAGASSVTDLMQKIQSNLEKEAEDLQKQKRIEEMEKALLHYYKFDLPSSLIRAETEERLRRKLQELKNQNYSEEDLKAKKVEIEKDISQEVDEALRLYFIRKQIASQGKISLSNNELNDEILQQISRNPMYYGKEMNKEASREMVSRMASALMDRKTKEYALSQVLSNQGA